MCSRHLGTSNPMLVIDEIDKLGRGVQLLLFVTQLVCAVRQPTERDVHDGNVQQALGHLQSYGAH